MTPSVSRRIYTVRPLTASILCIPGLLLCLWYAWDAYKRIDQYRRVSREAVVFTAETFHIQLFDLLRRDLRRISMEPPPENSKIDTFDLRIENDQLAKLATGAELKKSRPYVSAQLDYGGQLQPVKVRLRGQMHWHLYADQRSMKLRLPKGELLDGHRVFNLMNDPTPMVIGEQLILDIARERGVLTPRSAFARVRLNGKNLGVYHYETQPDESLLRTNRRLPGSIYSGNLGSSGDTFRLWNDSKTWKKPASRADTDEAEAYREDIDRFVQRVRRASFREFADFVEHEVDLEAFATMDLIDVAFGGNEHNFRQNHKYYFDPYRGRWEPIAWNFGGWRTDPLFNLVEHPVLIRLKMTPGYLTLRDRLLYEFLSDDGSAAMIRERGTKLLKKLAPELSTDPYWDAYHLLPRVDSFHRRMLRPLDLERAALVFESEVTTYRLRRQQLVRVLERNPLYLAIGTSAPVSAPPAEEGAERAPERVRTELEVVIDGRAGARVEALSVELPAHCSTRAWELRRGESTITTSTRKRAQIGTALDLVPAVRLVERENPSDRNGAIRTELVAVAYPLTIVAGCRPSAIVAEGTHLATGSRARSRAATAEVMQRVARRHAEPDAIPKLEVGEVAPHPWAVAPKPAGATTLGPGDVRVDDRRIFGADEVVTVAAGTRLRMATNASLVFLGKVTFAGTPDDPITVEPAAERWGGIAIQGPATAGSSIQHTVVKGGTTPKWRLIPYPGMVNVHDTSSITITNSRFGRNRGEGDVFHAAYVDGLHIEDSTITDASVDAWDLEFTAARLSRVSVYGTGDDAIDLMGSKVDLIDSVVAGCGGNGISAGEESEAKIRNTLVSHAKVGVLAKNASDVALLGSILFRNTTGVRVYERTVRYAGRSRVRANVLFVVDTKKKPIKRSDRNRDTLDQGRVQLSWPQRGVLDHVLEDVLALASWGDLEAWAATKKAGAVL